MMRLNVLIIFLGLTKLLIGQNLVVNPSFEDGLDSSDEDRSIIVKGWMQDPKNSTVDLFTKSDCKRPVYYSIEDTNKRTPAPYDSNTYLGFSIFSWTDYSEPITGTLKSPLLKDSLYIISFYLKYPRDLVMIYSKNIEILFSNKKPESNHGEPIFGPVYSEKEPLADVRITIEEAVKTDDWIKCKALYKAKGNEIFFTIGLFYQNKYFRKLNKKFMQTLDNGKKESKFLNSTALYPIYPNPYQNIDLSNKTYAYRVNNVPLAYYYIDDVKISPYKRDTVEEFVKSYFNENLYKYFYSRLEYPEDIVRKGIQGDVVVSFLIDKKGLLDSIEIIESPHAQMASGVSDLLLETKKKWSPTLKEGQPIAKRYKLIVKYQISSGTPRNAYNEIKEKVRYKISASRYKSALRNINKAISKFPYRADLYLIRSEIYRNLEQYENADKDYDKAHQLKQDVIAILGVILGS